MSQTWELPIDIATFVWYLDFLHRINTSDTITNEDSQIDQKIPKKNNSQSHSRASVVEIYGENI